MAKLDEAEKKKTYQAPSVLRRPDRRVSATEGGGSTACGFNLGLLDNPSRDRPFFLEGVGNVLIPGGGGEAVLPKLLVP